MTINELEAALVKLDEYAVHMQKLELAVRDAWQQMNAQTAVVAELLERLRDKEDPADWWKGDA